MKNIIVVQGAFAPLNQHEVAQIKTIHKQHPDALIALNDACNNPVFSQILNDFIAKYAYLVLNRTKRRPDITLEIELPFDLDNFYLFIGKKTLLADREIMEELVAKKLSPKRFKHSLSVAKLAQSLARRYHYPKDKAYLAGLLHDVVKEQDQVYLDGYLRYYDQSKLCEALPIKHSFCAKYYLKEHLNLYDDAILNAIYHHTDGKSNALLAKIIYIADKREPLRKIDDNLLSMAYTDIHKAFAELKIRVSEYINNENEFLKLVYKTIDDKQGRDIEIIDFQNHSPLFDYMVIASVLNERMANAVVEALKDVAVEQNHSLISVDKAAESKWFLIDLGDIVCHIFYDGQRAFYDLEGLWKDLGTIKM